MDGRDAEIQKFILTGLVYYSERCRGLARDTIVHQGREARDTIEREESFDEFGTEVIRRGDGSVDSSLSRTT